MPGDQMAEGAVAAIRFVMAVINNRGLIKYLAVAAYFFIVATFTLQPSSSCAQTSGNVNMPAGQVMSQLKEQLKLTEEQEIKIRPIIEVNIRKRDELLNAGAEKSDLQQLQWATDMQISKFLTEEQLKEYEKLREQEDKKPDGNGGSRRGRHGGIGRGF